MVDLTNFTQFSFWLATAMMLASTVFFFVERSDVDKKWKTSLTVAGLVTGIAFWHYLTMSKIAVTGASPVAYRYVDWFITVPLQIVEFYLILAAVTMVSSKVFWKLLVASLVMLIGGYCGETCAGWQTPGFVIGMIGWIDRLEWWVGMVSLDWQVGLLGWIGRLDWYVGLLGWIGRLEWQVGLVGWKVGEEEDEEEKVLKT